jgi:hypothetical protein
MYFVKPEYMGSVVTMPHEVKKSCAKLSAHFVILQTDTSQEALEFLYKYKHPGVGKKETKNDNSKGSS